VGVGQPAVGTAVSQFPDPEVWAGRRVLVTGNTGFKGSWLTYWLARLGADVLGLSLAEPPSEPSLWQEMALDVDTIRGDICVPTWVQRVRDYRPEVVFHLAAQPIVAEGFRSPGQTFDTNVSGVVRLLESLQDLPSLLAAVVITTDKVYDQRQTGPHDEEHFLGGRDPYSASKAAAELVCISWPDPTLPLVTARAGNVVGGGDWAADRLVPDMVRAWSSGTELTLRDPAGVRPWQHVLEPLRGYLLYAEALMEGRPVSGALNFGPSATDMVAVGDIVDFGAGVWAAGDRRQAASMAWAATAQRPYAETQCLTLSSTRAARELGWTGLLTWHETLAMTLAWYQSHLAGTSASRLVGDDLDAYCSKVDAEEVR
jgi:CDP-glucose 4,6-dehydratase